MSWLTTSRNGRESALRRALRSSYSDVLGEGDSGLLNDESHLESATKSWTDEVTSPYKICLAGHYTN